MPFDRTVLASLGGTELHNGELRAHLQLRNEEGAKVNIRGPCRTTEEEAQKDLRQIRAAGGVGETREEGLKIMEAEARRSKISAEYQSEIQQTIEGMASQEIADESDYDDERSDNSVPEWMQEYPSEENSPEESSQPARPILASQLAASKGAGGRGEALRIRRTSSEVAGRDRFVTKILCIDRRAKPPPSADPRLCRRPLASTTTDARGHRKVVAWGVLVCTSCFTKPRIWFTRKCWEPRW